MDAVQVDKKTAAAKTPPSNTTAALITGGAAILLGLIGYFAGKKSVGFGVLGAAVGGIAGWFARGPIAGVFKKDKPESPDAAAGKAEGPKPDSPNKPDGFVAKKVIVQRSPPVPFAEREKQVALVLANSAAAEWKLGVSDRGAFETEIALRVDTPENQELKALENPWDIQVGPAGTTWNTHVGHSNYAVVPFSTAKGQWISVGVEHAVEPQKGGARHGVAGHGFVFPFHPGVKNDPANQNLAERLEKLADTIDPSKTPVELKAGETFSRAADDARLDAAMLRLAAGKAREGEQFCMRTLLLSTDSHPSKHYASFMPKIPSGGFLAASLDAQEPQTTGDVANPPWAAALRNTKTVA